MCPLQDMLVFLYLEGPYTRGIFRRSAGAKACRELRDRLDSGTEDPEITHQSVFVIAAVLKVTHTLSTTHSSGLPHWFEPDNRKQERLMCFQSHINPDRIICLCTARQAASHTHKVLHCLAPGHTATTAMGIQGAAEGLWGFIQS